MNQWVSEANEDEWDSEAPDTYWYYYGKDGRSVISKWQEIDGKNYYFNDEGHMQTGMLELDGATSVSYTHLGSDHPASAAPR